MRAVCAPKCWEKDAHADFLCLHCYPNAVGDNTWAYFFCILNRAFDTQNCCSELPLVFGQFLGCFPLHGDPTKQPNNQKNSEFGNAVWPNFFYWKKPGGLVVSIPMFLSGVVGGESK